MIQGLLKRHYPRLRLAACGGERGRERAWRSGPAAPRSFSLLGVERGTHVMTFERPWLIRLQQCVFARKVWYYYCCTEIYRSARAKSTSVSVSFCEGPEKIEGKLRFYAVKPPILTPGLDES